ncbi:hypothetical protein BST43_00320 [Mycobacteroides saopaulense]|uniref:Uncharacterized protein n=1 Tax=Mycobacteroides saopaulense TaxID=1578165 RepID=A0A1X0JDB1_9MYCO|nr:hypothetical protein BST43_00320 [Mycobacteroides saopaulense]
MAARHGRGKPAELVRAGPSASPSPEAARLPALFFIVYFAVSPMIPIPLVCKLIAESTVTAVTPVRVSWPSKLAYVLRAAA